MNEVLIVHFLFQTENIRLLLINIGDNSLDKIALALNLVSAGVNRSLRGRHRHNVSVALGG